MAAKRAKRERRSRVLKQVKFVARTVDELHEKMAEIATDDLCWVTMNAFEFFTARAYRIPSHIPHTAVGDAPWQARGYWRNGELHPFSDRLTIRYQNAGLGCE